MSRAYRIKVREVLRRVIRAEDHVSTTLEILEILPADQMSDLLAAELAECGFEREGDNMIRVADDVTVTVDLKSGEVTVRAESSQGVELEAERSGRAFDDEGQGRKQAEAQLSAELRKDLEKAVDSERDQLQKVVTDELESQLGDVKAELDRAVNRATAEALKQKASQLGQIKQLTEDRETGSLTIVVEV